MTETVFPDGSRVVVVTAASSLGGWRGVIESRRFNRLRGRDGGGYWVRMAASTPFGFAGRRLFFADGEVDRV